MRSPRIVFAILTLALAASMGLSPTSATARVDLAGSEARPSADRVAGLAAPSSARSSERAAPITITAKVVKRRVRPGGPKRLVLQGAVNPPTGPVYIQKGTKCNRRTGNCNFKFFRKVFLKKGRNSAVIDAPPRLRGWVWRAKVRTDVSPIWVTCTRRPGQDCKVPY